MFVFLRKNLSFFVFTCVVSGVAFSNTFDQTLNFAQESDYTRLAVGTSSEPINSLPNSYLREYASNGTVSKSKGAVYSSAPVIVDADVIAELGELEIPIPTSWKIDKSKNDRLLAVESGVNTTYKKNIAVRRFEGKIFIDDISAKRFSELVEIKYPMASNSIVNYRNQEPEYVTLENGSEAILIYSSFSMTGIDMMHMHLVVSTEMSHFLVTYTDLYESVSKEESESFQLAWNMLSNVKVPYTQSGGRFYSTVYTVGGGVLLFVSLFMWGFIRRRLVGAKISSFNDEYGDEIDDELDHENEWIVDDDYDYEEDDDVSEELLDDDELEEARVRKKFDNVG